MTSRTNTFQRQILLEDNLICKSKPYHKGLELELIEGNMIRCVLRKWRELEQKTHRLEDIAKYLLEVAGKNTALFLKQFYSHFVCFVVVVI